MHTLQAKATACLGRRTRVEPHAVVFDDQHDEIVAPFEDDFDAAGARMLGDVGECFLRDSVERGFGFGRQTIVHKSGGVQLRANGAALRPVLNVIAKRGQQAQVVERRRPELPHQVLDVAVELS